MAQNADCRSDKRKGQFKIQSHSTPFVLGIPARFLHQNGAARFKAGGGGPQNQKTHLPPNVKPFFFNIYKYSVFVWQVLELSDRLSY